MPQEANSVPVNDPTALAELKRLESLQQGGLQAAQEIRRLLEPIREELSALVLEHDRLYYEALAARQKFFQLAKQTHPALRAHGSLRYEKRGQEVHVLWDDTGPRFSAVDGGDLPTLHPFEARQAGRRASDLMHWLS
jgi:hypothetical protein